MNLKSFFFQPKQRYNNFWAILFYTFFFTNLLNSQSKEIDEIDLEIKKYLYKIQENDVDEKKLKELEIEIENYKKSNSFPDVKQELDQNLFEFSNVNTKTYVVKPNDTLFSISKQFKMNVNQIFDLNPELKTKPLYIGQVIKVIDNVQEDKNSDWRIETKEIFEEKSYIVAKGDTLSSIAKKFNTTVEELLKINKLKRNSILKINTKIIISRYKIVKEFKVRKFFIKPVDGYITSTFGYRKNPFIDTLSNFHNGVDFAAPIGTPIVAAKEGIVIFSGRMVGYGNCIFIRHPQGYITVYGHNKVNYVKVGDIVEKGQKIGEVGRTGYATGPHLHFEVRKLDRVLNPLVALQWEERVEISNKRIALK